MGQLVKTIEGQQSQINDMKIDLKAAQEIPIKLATFEADIKYLIRQISEIEQFLRRKAGE